MVGRLWISPNEKEEENGFLTDAGRFLLIQMIG
jgi:hypothetical protein